MHEVSSPIFTSGLAFHKISKWSFDTRYPIIFEPIHFLENDLVFLNLDYFKQMVDLLEKTPPKHKFMLITHNSDNSFTDYHYKLIGKYVTKIYAINNTCKNENVHTIPIGFRDYDDNKIVNITIKEKYNKPILCYLNFKLDNTDGFMNRYNIRLECYNKFKDNSWVIQAANLPLLDFYKDMSLSKYVLSPQGVGIDCHRIYESIYFNSIPILKTSQLDDFYQTLPVIIVKEWNEITKQFLLDNYETYYLKLKEWKQTNKWLTPEYWL